MEKKGSHVGFILSALVFVSFLVFLFAAIEPSFISDEDKIILLNHIKNEIISESSSELVTITMKIRNPNNSKNCFSINADYLNYFGDQEICNLSIKDENGDLLNYKIMGDCDNVTSLKIEQRGGFLKFYYSSALENSLCSKTDLLCSVDNCQDIKKNNYDIGQIKSDDYLFLSSSKNLAEDYVSDYEDVKDRLGISARDDFDFLFLDNAENDLLNLSYGADSVTANILTEQFPIIYIDDRADFKSGFLRVRVW